MHNEPPPTPRRPLRSTALLAVLACACTNHLAPHTVPALTASVSEVATVTRPSSGAQRPSPAQLRSELLTAHDIVPLLPPDALPNGLTTWKPPNNPPQSASRPECATTLNDLELNPPNTTSVLQAKASYQGGPDGPWIQEVLRSYPTSQATDTLRNTATVLSSCGTDTLTYSDGSHYQETVATPTPAAVGDQGWSTTITVDTGTFIGHETLVLTKVGDKLIILSLLQEDQPATATVLALAKAAAAKAAT
jgi:hypothetical protein